MRDELSRSAALKVPIRLTGLILLSPANVASAYILSTPPNAYKAIQHLQVSHWRRLYQVRSWAQLSLGCIRSKRSRYRQMTARSTSTWVSFSKQVREMVERMRVRQVYGC